MFCSAGGGIAEHRQRLIAVRGDDRHGRSVRGAASPAQIVTPNASRMIGAHRRAKPDAPAERLQQFLEIVARAAADRPPGRPLMVDQAVVLEERDEARRPDSRAS